MKILIDIMSGDKAPVEQLVGAVQAAVETPSVSFGFIEKDCGAFFQFADDRR